MSQKYTEYLKKLMKSMADGIDREWMIKNTIDLWRVELPQTWPAYKASADHIEKLLKKEGFDVERITFPADGKTVYQDKRMPLAWDATMGRLTITKSEIEFDDPVIADYDRHPFHLMRASTSLPEGGVEARLVSEKYMREGGDCKGAIVLFDRTTSPNAPAVVPALDSGAIGFAADFLAGGDEAPDCIQWATAVTEGSHWHCQCEDRDYVGYSISPNTGKKLREALAAGEVWVKAESNGRRYEDEIYTITALIPGKRKEEVWIFAHLYEPLVTDNSAGVIGSVAIAKQIQKMVEDGTLPPLEFSIRLVFGMEFYGFAATADYFGDNGNLRNRTIAAIDLDGLPIGKPDKGPIHLMIPPEAVPCYGGYIMEMLAEANKDLGYMPTEVVRGLIVDDMFLGDATTGLPTVWPKNGIGKKRFWHNSYMDENYLGEENMTRIMAYGGAWIAAVSTMNSEILADGVCAAKALAEERIKKAINAPTIVGCKNDEIEYYIKAESSRLGDFRRVADIPEIKEAIDSLAEFKGDFDNENKTPWVEEVKNLVPRRTTVGIPFDLIKLPKEKRKAIPDGTLYGPMGTILVDMDGKKNLAQIIYEALWETEKELSEELFKTYVDAVKYFADAGYVEFI